MDAKLRQMVVSRASLSCEYCRMPQRYDSAPMQVDHIISEQHGGQSESENLAFACLGCNKHKGPNIAGIDPLTGELSRLFHPRRDRWNDHFQWIGPEVLGLTPVGRTTIYVLAMNDELAIAVRADLMQEGAFPQAQEFEIE